MTLRLAWVTNLAAPYRLPAWEALAQRTHLIVGLLAENEHNRHWSPPSGAPYDLRVLEARGWRHGEATHYTLTRPRQLPTNVDALILPGWESPAAWQLLRWARRCGVATLAFHEATR